MTFPNSSANVASCVRRRTRSPRRSRSDRLDAAELEKGVGSTAPWTKNSSDSRSWPVATYQAAWCLAASSQNSRDPLHARELIARCPESRDKAWGEISLAAITSPPVRRNRPPAARSSFPTTASSRVPGCCPGGGGFGETAGQPCGLSGWGVPEGASRRSLDRPPGTPRRWWRGSHRPLPRRRAGVLTRTPPATGSRTVDESAVRDGIRFRGDDRWRETFLAESEIEIGDRDERDDDRGKGELDERRSELLSNGFVRRRDVDDRGNDDGRDDCPEHDEQLHQHESAEHGPPSPPDEIRRTSQRLSPGTPFENNYRHHDKPREPEIDARDDETNQSETRQHCDGDAGRDDGSGPGESDTDRPAPVCRAARGKICRRVHAGRLGEEAPEDEHGETDQLGGPRAPRRIQARRALLPPVPESRATDDERRDEDDSGRTDENAVVRQTEIDRARREFPASFGREPLSASAGPTTIRDRTRSRAWVLLTRHDSAGNIQHSRGAARHSGCIRGVLRS